MLRPHVIAALRRGKHVAAEVESLDAGSRGFVGVYPLDAARDRQLLARYGGTEAEGERCYRVRVFDVRTELIQADAWIAEPDLHNREDCLAIEETLPAVLARFGVRIEDLTQPWQANYPI